MLSFNHEILVELFRENGELAAELLRTCAGIQLDHARIERGSIDLSRVAPTGYYADTVSVLYDSDDHPVTGVIVEVQRHIDRVKLRTWPVYVTALRAQLDCSAMLLVVAPDPGVAAWARRPIELGHPGFRLAPIVIGFDEVPEVRDPVAASRLPELAVLSTLAHPELEIAEAAIGAIAQLPEDQARLYLDVIMMALPAVLRQILEDRMLRGYEYQSEFARKYYGQGRQEGREEGREEGRQEGREEGRQEGREEGLRAAVMALAQTKLKTASADDLARIAAITDLAVLTELVTALGRARSRAEAHAALEISVNR